MQAPPHPQGTYVLCVQQTRISRNSKLLAASSSGTRRCYRCNQLGHTARNCTFTEANNSQQVGPIRGEKTVKQPKQRDNVQATNGICHLEGTTSSLVASEIVNGKPMDCLVDTGATVSLILNNLVGGSVTERAGKENVKSVDGGSLQIIGSVVLPVSFGSRSAEQKFFGDSNQIVRSYSWG